MMTARYRTYIVYLLFLMSMLTAHAQKLTVDQPEINCGKSLYNTPVTATFEIVNPTTKHIVITDTHADCGCTKPRLSRKDLGAGDKCTVKLTYDGRILGHYQKGVTISYHAKQGSDKTLQQLYLVMKGVIVTELKDYSATYPYAMGDLLADKNILEFDDVKKGDHPEQEIHIINNGTGVMTPNIQHLPPYLSAIATPEQLMPGCAGKIQITLSSQKINDYGLTQATVYLASHLGDKVSPTNEMPVSVVLLPDLSTFDGKNKQYAPKIHFSSEKIELGEINGRKVRKSEITITNRGRLALKVSSIQMFTNGMKLTLDKSELQPGEQAKLKVTGDCDILRKSRTKPRILMITNDPDHAKVTIPIIVH